MKKLAGTVLLCFPIGQILAENRESPVRPGVITRNGRAAYDVESI